MAVTSKKARRERSHFTLQFEVSHEESQTIVSWSELLLWRSIYKLKAIRNGWIALVFTKRAQTSIYNFVTVGFARWNPIYGFFFPHLMSPLVQFLMNAKILKISKIIWWNKRECVTVVETQNIIASKRFIYSLSTGTPISWKFRNKRKRK